MDINNYRAKWNIETEELLNLKTVDQTDIFEILAAARDLKIKARLGERMKKLAGKNIFFMAKNSLPVKIFSLWQRILTVSQDLLLK